MLFLCSGSTCQTWWTESCSWFWNLTRRKIYKIDFFYHIYIYYLCVLFYIFIHSYIYIFMYLFTHIYYLYILFHIFILYIILFIIIYYYLYYIILFIVLFIVFYYIIILLYNYMTFIIYISIWLIKTTQEMKSSATSNNDNSCEIRARIIGIAISTLICSLIRYDIRSPSLSQFSRRMLHLHGCMQFCEIRADNMARARFLEGTFLEACKCNKAKSDNNIYDPRDPMNVSSRAQSFTWITPFGDSYVLVAAVSAVRQEVVGVTIVPAEKAQPLSSYEKMIPHPSSRITPRRFIRHFDLMHVLFPIPLLPSIYPLNRVARAVACKRESCESKFTPLRK